MIVRNPTAGEVERAIDVAAIAFPNLTHEHWTNSFQMVTEVFGTRFLLVVEDEGLIVSTLICQPLPVYVNGSPVPHASTGAVATIPEARCKGCAGAMMAECVRLLRSEGVYLSSLWPFSYPYYRKFGWEIGAEVRNYSAPAKVFAEFGSGVGCRLATPEDKAQIRSVFSEWAPGYNCLTQRTEVWWERVIGFRLLPTDAGHATVVHETDGKIDSYAAYRTTEEPTSIYVLEMAFDEPRQRKDMLAWVAATVDPEASVSFGAPIDDLFLQEIPNPRLLNTGISPSFQFRVTDPPRAMECMEVDDEVSGCVSFCLTDPVFAEGWEFGIEVGDGSVSLTKPDRKRRLKTSVETFARLYSGYLTAYDALELGKLELEGDCCDMLFTACEVFSPLTPYRSSLEPG